MRERYLGSAGASLRRTMSAARLGLAPLPPVGRFRSASDRARTRLGAFDECSLQRSASATIITRSGRRSSTWMIGPTAALRLITLYGFAVFCVVPLVWLLLAPTKDDAQLTGDAARRSDRSSACAGLAAPRRLQRRRDLPLDGELGSSTRSCRWSSRWPSRCWPPTRSRRCDSRAQADPHDDAARDGPAGDRAGAAAVPRAERLRPDQHRSVGRSCRRRSSRSASTSPSSTSPPRCPTSSWRPPASTDARRSASSGGSRCRWRSR